MEHVTCDPKAPWCAEVGSGAIHAEQLSEAPERGTQAPWPDWDGCPRLERFAAIGSAGPEGQCLLGQQSDPPS